jgi:hypothetical protein
VSDDPSEDGGSDDPFEDIDPDDYRDREGNPFDAFGDGEDGDEDDHGELGGHEHEADTSGDPFEYLGGGASPDDADPASGTGAGDDPSTTGDQSVDVAGDAFGDVDVSRGDPFESADSPFRQVDVESVDPDEVWERFTGETERVETKQNEALGGDDVPEDAAEVVEVPKGRFCQTCPHFSTPPETACSHPGTEVLTFVGTDEVRVSNCPVVRERRELGETYD